MQARAWIAWGLVATMAAGSSIALAAAEEEGTVTEVAVPVGGTGDRVEYLIVSHEEVDGELVPVHGGLTRQVVYENQGLVQSLDPAGGHRDTLRVFHGRIESGDGFWKALDIDLASRGALVRTDFEDVQGEQLYGRSAYASLPNMAETFPIRQYAWQGSTLRLGDDVTPADAVAFWKSYVETRHGVEVTGMSYACTVSEAGVLEGTDVLGIRCDHEFDMLDGGSPLHDVQSWTSWFADGVAYPVRMDYAHAVTGAQTREERRSYVLTNLTPAGTPIPWRSTESVMSLQQRTWAGERGAGAGLESGQDPALSFTLDAAKQAAWTDPSLVGFSEWRATNPDAWFAGADYLGGPGDGTWYLTWAAEDLYRVRVDRLAQGVAVSQEHMVEGQPVVGRIDVEAPDMASERPERPLTLGSSHALAGRVVTPEAHGNLVRMSWGWAWNLEALDGWTFRSVFLTYEDPAAVPGSVREEEVVRIEIDRGQLVRSDRSMASPAFPPLPAGDASDAPDNVMGQAAPMLIAPEFVTSATAAAALAGLGLLAMLAVAVRDGLPGLAAMFGFTRLTPHAILDHPLRARIHDMVSAEPGITASTLRRRLDKPSSTVFYHARRLLETGVLTRIRQGNRVHLYPGGHTAPHRQAVLQNDRTRQAFDMIRKKGTKTRQEIAAALGITVPSTLWHLDRLCEVGLVNRERAGRRVLYHHVR